MSDEQEPASALPADDFAALRALATAINYGPWEIGACCEYSAYGSDDMPGREVMAPEFEGERSDAVVFIACGEEKFAKPFAEYVVAASPEKIIALVGALSSTRAELTNETLRADQAEETLRGCLQSKATILEEGMRELAAKDETRARVPEVAPSCDPQGEREGASESPEPFDAERVATCLRVLDFHATDPVNPLWLRNDTNAAARCIRSLRSALDEGARLTNFGALMLREYHIAAGNDLDALDVQNRALLAGVIEWVSQQAPCGPDCACATIPEVRFPQDCLREPDAVHAACLSTLAAIDAARRSDGKATP